MWDTLKQWDRELFIFLNNLRIEEFDGFWLFVTQIETWTPLFILFFVLLLYYYKMRIGLGVIYFLLFSFGITILSVDIVKESVARLRPNNVEALSELIQVLQTPSNYSFFSGHAASSFSITVFVALALRKHTKWIVIAFLWPLLFVLSRIYVGVHYPSDLLVGSVVGSLIAFGSYQLCKKSLGEVNFL